MVDKKYYWLKLKKDFFKRHDIKIIESMPNGKDYILFYLKLLVESVDHDGSLRFNDTVPYDEQMLSVITNTNIDIVRNAMKIFTELRMIDIMEDQTIFMTEVEKMMGAETYWAEQKRKQRNKELASGHCPKLVQPVQPLSKQEIELDIEIDKDKDIKDIVPFKDIIDYLNLVCSTKFKVCKSNKRFINARWEEKNTFDDFKTVIDKKAKQWLGDQKMQEYLRPSTLFGTKFNEYLGQKEGPNGDGNGTQSRTGGSNKKGDGSPRTSDVDWENEDRLN